jgi:hypothetical protein
MDLSTLMELWVYLGPIATFVGGFATARYAFHIEQKRDTRDADPPHSRSLTRIGHGGEAKV